MIYNIYILVVVSVKIAHSSNTWINQQRVTCVDLQISAKLGEESVIFVGTHPQQTAPMNQHRAKKIKNKKSNLKKVAILCLESTRKTFSYYDGPGDRI